MCASNRETADNIISWMSANLLKVNPNKTEIAVFGSRQMLAKTNVKQLHIGSDNMSTAGTLQYLGVVLDNSLSFQDHIRNARLLFGI